MDIVFKFGEHYYEVGDSGTFLSVIITFFGAFLGLLSALLVDRMIKSKEQNKINKENKISKYNQLSYFRDSIESVLNFIPKQTLQHVEFSKNLKSKPLEIIIPNISATFDLLRLRNVDTKENQEAFFEFFEKNNVNIKLYRNSISYADYLCRIFHNSETIIKRAIDFKHKDQQVVRDCIEEVSILIGLRMKTLKKEEKQNEDEYQFLSNIIGKYNILIVEFLIFKNVRNNFVNPLFTEALPMIKDKDTSQKVFVLCRKASSILNKIEANAIQVASDFENFEDQTLKSIEHLTKISEEIDKITMS